MTTYLALLRGINVSGQKKVPMAQLRELLSNNGLKEVRTYIQTGNVMFQAEDPNGWDDRIKEIIQKHFGWEVCVLVRSASEITKLVDNCPFPPSKKEKSYFILLESTPDPYRVEEVKKVSVNGEAFVFGKNCIYFYSDHGYGRAKLNNNWFEKKLNVSATSRNYRTLTKILQLMRE